MMRCAEEVIVVADQSKFGRRGLARLSGWEAVHRVIADEGLEARWHQVVRDAGAELILAEVKKGNGGTASVEAGAWRRAELRSDLRR
jgi:hypothetical protein